MDESRIIKVQKNLMSAFIQNILNFFLVMASRMIFVRILEADYLGINGLFSNILNILSLADMGIGTAMMYSLYKPIANGEIGKINDLIAFFRKIYLLIAISVFAIGMMFIPFLQYIIRLETDIPYLKVYYILALLNIVISYLFVYRTTLLNADQKSYILNRYIMLFKIITFIAQTGMLIVFRNYFLYLLVALFTNFFSNLVQNHITLKIYPYLKQKPDALDILEKKEIERNVKATFLYKICGIIQSNTDNILTSVFAGTIFVGYYSNYSMVVNVVVSVLNMIFVSVKASIGNIIASADASHEKNNFYFRVAELINFWLVAFCCVSFVCLFQEFIELAFGRAYVLEFSVMTVIVLNFYTSNIRQTIWIFRETTGLFHETKYVTAVTAILNLFLSLVLGYFWGLTGIIAATVLARMIYAWWKEPMVLYHNFFQKKAIAYYVTYIKRICFCVIACIITYVMCGLFSNQNLYLRFIEHIGVCLVVPNFLFLSCYFKTDEFKYIYNKLIVIIKYKTKKE